MVMDLRQKDIHEVIKHVMDVKCRREAGTAMGSRRHKKGSLKVSFAVDSGSLAFTLFLLQKPSYPKEQWGFYCLLCFRLSVCLHFFSPLSSCPLPALSAAARFRLTFVCLRLSEWSQVAGKRGKGTRAWGREAFSGAHRLK